MQLLFMKLRKKLLLLNVFSRIFFIRIRIINHYTIFTTRINKNQRVIRRCRSCVGAAVEIPIPPTRAVPAPYKKAPDVFTTDAIVAIVHHLLYRMCCVLSRALQAVPVLQAA